MSGEGGGWQAEFTLSEEAYLQAFEAALDGIADAITTREIDGGPRWRVIAHGVGEPDRAMLVARIGVAAASAGIDMPEMTVEAVPATDWVADYRRQTEPITVGSFFVFPAHYDGEPLSETVAIRLDAGLAFGTGEHESTAGCLLAIDRLHRDGHGVGCALDMGCGSAILAMAIALLWPEASVIAVDNDPIAIRTALDNVADNQCAHSVTIVPSEGFAAGSIGTVAPFDLIAANILARPLIAMAGDTANHLAVDGFAILSGLLSEQVKAVQSAYQQVGLRLSDRFDLGDWATLVLTPDR